MVNEENDKGGTDTSGNIIPQSKSEASAGLLKAARSGDFKAFNYFLQTGLADVNAMNQNGLTALHLAAKEGHTEIISELIRNGANVNSRTLKGNSPIHVASLAGHEKIVRLLVKHGAKVNVQSQMGFSPLYMASQENHPDIVQFLLDNDADPNVTTEDGYTPLSVAIQQGHNRIASMLMDYDKRGGRVRLPALHVAAKKNDVEAARLLLEDPKNDQKKDKEKDKDKEHVTAVNETTRLPRIYEEALIKFHPANSRFKSHQSLPKYLLNSFNLNGASSFSSIKTHSTGFTSLHIASHYGSAEVAKLLLDNGADPNFPAKNEVTPIHVASKWGRDHLVRILAEYGADLNSRTKDDLTPLHCAARSGYEGALEVLLKHGADVAAKSRNGLSALHCAAQGDHLNCVSVLLKYRSNIEDVTMDYLTPLHVASHCGNHNIVQLLLDNGCEIDARALNGFTALHVACKKNRIRVIEILLRYGVNVECTTETGLTPLHVASFMGHVAVVSTLLDLGNARTDSVTTRGETALHLAARAEQYEIMKILLRHNADPNALAKEHQTALHMCARLGNTDGMKLLLDHGADVDAKTKDSYTALHIGVKENHEPVVRLLLDRGAKHSIKTNKGFSPLHVAAKYGNTEIARILLDKGSSPGLKGRNGLTALHVATHYNKPEVAKVLIEHGASPHDTAKNGYSPLHIAAKRNHLDLAVLLVDSGAHPNAESKNGFTPLHLASMEGHTEMVSFLLSHGSKSNIVSRNGLTPMHLAAQEDQVPVAEVLVEYNALTDPETKAGYTPLHTACHFGQINMIKFLLERGVPVDSTTKMGYTPLHVAAQQGHVLVINILIKHRANPDIIAKNGLSAMAIAERMGFHSVMEVLNEVTTVTVQRPEPGDKYEMVVPEIMHENIADSDEEGPDDVFATPKPTDEITLNLHTSEDSYGGQIESTQQYTPADRYKEITRLTPSQDLFSFESGRRSVTSSIGGLGAQDPLQDEMSYMREDSDWRPPVTPSTASIQQRSSVFSGEQQYTPGTAEYDYRYMLREDSRMDSLAPPTPVTPAHLPAVNGRAPRYVQSEADDDDLVAVKSAGTESAAVFSTTSNMTDWSRDGDNEKTNRPPAASGFLVSFMVDARGGVLHSSRHSGVRITVPAGRACMPTRITCKLVKKERLINPPPVMEGEALATRILQMGPVGATFSGPILIEVPHYASLASREREIVIMKSSNGRVWSEFSTQPSRDQVIEVIGETTVNYLESRSDYEASRGVARILTDTLPSYYAIVSRIRHDAATLDENGGEIVSSINPLVKTCFPQGALTKSIRVGIQVHPMNEELVQKVLGDEAYVSPVVSVEPRHRKFHQPISITIPLPLAPSQGKSPTKRQTGSPTLRLLASIVGGMAPSQWEDVTGSSPMTVSNQTVTFTSTLSARFMLMECRNFNESARLANALYSQAIFVPFLTKFVVFGKRRTADEARLRAFVMTDDADMMKTLENQQNFVEVARSRDIEVFDDRPLYIDAVGKLVPHSVRSGGYPSNPLTLQFRALHENRLAFNVRVRDPNSDPTGQVIFVNEPLIGRGSGHHERVNPSCVLNVTLPDLVERVTPGKGGRLPANQRTPGLDLEGRRPALFKSKRGPGILTKAELHLEDIASELDDDWVRLAPELKFTDRDIKMLEETSGTSTQKGSTMLHSWLEGYEEGRIGAVSDLEAALGRIGREDIVYACIRDVSERDDVRYSTDVSDASDVRVNIKNGDLNDIQRNLDIIERDITMFPESQAHNIHPKTLYGVKEYNQVQADLPVVSPDRATNEMTEDFDENSDVMAESIEDLKDDPAYTKTSETSYQNIPERDKKWSERDNRDEMRWGDVEMQEDVIRITAEAPNLSEYSNRSGENENLSYEDNEYGLRKGSFYDDMGEATNEGRGQELEEQEEVKEDEVADDFEMVSGDVAQEEEEAGRPPIFSEKSLQFSMDSELEKEASVDDAAQDVVNIGSQLETQDTLRMQHYEEAADLLGDYIKEEKEVPVSEGREDGDQDSLLEASEVQRDASMPLPDGWVEYEKEKSESSSENEEEALSQEGVPVAMMEPLDEDRYLNDDDDEMVTKEELERKEFQPDILENLENIGGEEDGSELGESFGQEYRNKPEEEFPDENVIEDYNQNEENGENYAADQVEYDNNTEDYPADQRYTEEVVSFPDDTPEQEGDDESAGSVSSRGSSVRVVRDISVGDPSISRNEYETEEVLEDGTVVTRRVVTTEQTQTITNRYVAYATEDQEEQAKEMLGSLQFDPADGGDVQTEEIEEVLDDGTVVKKTITRVLRREVVQGEVEYPEEQED